MPSLIVACPHCHGLNRLPQDRLDEGGKCGRCHQSLFAGHPVALGEAAFDAHSAKADLPLLVDFWAPWCGPCRSFAPVFERAAQRLEPRVRLAKVNTEEVPELARRHGIRSIPTLMLLHRGREIARVSGAMDANSLERWVQQHLPGMAGA
jgi:thioredoxin 2